MFRKLVSLLIFAAIAGCQTAPLRQIPDPPLQPQLISAAPLQIASACVVSSAVDIDYSVQTDGSVSDLSMSDAPPCVRDALRAWVSSYRYAPPSAPVATGFAWMRVTAQRGS
jgi:hypothetical protein